ncbi:GSCOCG00004311001-RA-CDS, partial [Cotesia congregata]
MLHTIVIFCVTLFAYAEEISPGRCPHVMLDTQLNLSKYQGQWHEYKRSTNIWSNTEKCTSMTYKKIGNRWTVIFAGISSVPGYTGSHSTTFSDVSLIGNSKIGVINYQAILGPAYSEYYILETDNENYSIVWSCENKESGHKRNAWILSRKRHPTIDIDKIARITFAKHCIEIP